MDEQTERKLTKKEKQIIDDIEEKAKKRRRKKKYNVKFVMESITGHSFPKSRDILNRTDLIDLLNSVATIAIKVGFYTDKQAKEYVDYYTKEYADAWFGDDKG